jgi:hypothetical protein
MGKAEKNIIVLGKTTKGGKHTNYTGTDQMHVDKHRLGPNTREGHHAASNGKEGW